MYVANGVATAFPLPEGADGSVVFLISPTGEAARVEACAVTNGSVVFDTPPPAGWTVAFELPPNTPALNAVTVVYPDGTIKHLSQDPYELLIEAKAERDEIKKLLRDAKNNLDAVERVVHVESEIAKEKLSARLEKYGSLVEDSVTQAASAARDQVQDFLTQLIQEVRTKHDETLRARDEVFTYKESAEQAAAAAAAETATNAQQQIDAMTANAIEAYERTKAMRSEVIDFRDQAQNAASSTALKIQDSVGLSVNALMEQIRSLRSSVEHELQTVVSRANSEINNLVSEVKTARDATQSMAQRVLEIERQVMDLDREQKAREEGMRALWTRIAGFKKTFDHRVSQMRGTATEPGAVESGEGEE